MTAGGLVQQRFDTGLAVRRIRAHVPQVATVRRDRGDGPVPGWVHRAVQRDGARRTIFEFELPQNRPAGEREVDVEEWDLVRAKVLRRAPIAIAADRDGRVDVVEEPRPLERVRQEVRGLDAWAEIRAEDHGVRIREFAAERRTDRGPVVEEADVGPVTRL